MLYLSIKYFIEKKSAAKRGMIGTKDYERVRLMVPKIKDVSVPELRFGTVVSVLVIMPFTVYPNYSFVDDVCEPQKVGHECELDDEL
jgi:flagellar assembly factor FliW